MLDFSSDYNVGAAEEILDALVRTNNERTATYGLDKYSESAKQKIRELCGTPDARIHFLVGGTQTNATVLSAILASYEGVISAETGHIATHESGAIEYTGHKVITVPHRDGKISASDVESVFHAYDLDETRDHTVKPGAVYISFPTEYGTVYSLSELEAISAVCKKYSARLFIDGARLGYGLMADGGDVTLRDIAQLSDVFYIGGTKVGALFGEAVVITNPNICPHFFTTVKQHGALLAKGRMLGIQFDTLFTDGLYERLGANAIRTAMKLKAGLIAKGYKLHIDSPTNQQFIIIDNTVLPALREKVVFNIWERPDDSHTVIRLVTSFVTSDTEIDELLAEF